ncbi:MAG: DUF2723 domain-containing protein [Ignavibacteriales bacterium CG12_big_fil_rev_8_21_14_0_65_30_8]|nr:MAG: DUF2723 domain-containing protein [Ignavibacteriales bacterium CG12_big_fil_rev_8_21_14_0_65_30_8]
MEKNNYSLLNKIFAGIVFLISTIILFSTVQPSVSFWDAGEFISSAYYLQVPHPPGAPFFSIVGRIFAIVPFVENVALRVNTISVLASSFSILFLYLIAVKLINSFKEHEHKDLLDAVSTFLAAAIGALAFSFSDTFWFNAVEAEVYASSTLLFSAITYLMMSWAEKADNVDNEKYILMIAYLIGVSTGVHLMSVLAIVSVVMMIMFKKYVDNDEALKSSIYILLINVGIVLILAFLLWGNQTRTTPPSAEEYAAFDSKFKMIMAAVTIIIMGAFWKKVFSRNSIYVPLMLGGVALFLTYPGIVKILPGIMANISGDNSLVAVLVFAIILGLFGYAVHYAVKNKKPTMHLAFMSLIFILLGFTSYTMVIIRSNQDPPMNENEPNDFTELVSYLNRDQYGDFPIFERRFATEPHQLGVYTNYSSELDFWWKYQMNHMTTRYLLWNFAGREGWNQDDGPNIAPFNGIGNILGSAFNIRFGGSASTSLYGIPFLIGLLGIYFHFKKDWKTAIIFMVLFIFMGYFTAFYQNQQQPQPRERDYFYVGAFFIFGIWIAIGFRGLIDLIQEKLKKIQFKKAAIITALALGVVFIPLRMLVANYNTHDRSNNWVPWDYSYNILQSCAPNAILFTNGDNDTFPLWYLQDVEGIRRDVKIVNLSLANTHWYIRQLKNNDPYNVGTVKIRFSDSQIDRISPVQWEPRDITIPLPADKNSSEISKMVKEANIEDSTVIKAGSLTFRMDNTVTFGTTKAIRIQDIIVKEIIEANEWKRPVYFSVTCAPDSKIGLDDYLKIEGMTSRLIPEKRKPNVEFVNETALREELLLENINPSKTFKRGFRFRGLNDKSIFYEDGQQGMLQNYRNAYLKLAMFYLDTNQRSKVTEILNAMNEKISTDVINIDYRLLAQIGNVYFQSGNYDKFKELSVKVENEALNSLENNPKDLYSFRVLLDLYQNLNDNKKLLALWERIEQLYPGDPGVKANIAKYKSIVQQEDSLKTMQPIK